MDPSNLPLMVCPNVCEGGPFGEDTRLGRAYERWMAFQEVTVERETEAMIREEAAGIRGPEARQRRLRAKQKELMAELKAAKQGEPQ